MKDLLITHTDLDGISPIILMNLTGINYEYKSIEIYDVDTTFEDLLKTDLNAYNNIFIVDLTIPKDIYEQLKEYNNVKVFDHHETHLYANEYPFAEVKVKEFGHLTCGTELFYNYLVKQYKNLDTKLIRDYIEIVRQNDTWDWVDRDFASKVGALPFVYGKKDFIKSITKRLKKDKDKFELTAFEKRYTKLQSAEMERYLKLKEKELKKYVINNYKVGIVFAENHKSELGNYLSAQNPDLDLIAIINNCEKISYRTTRDDVRCNDFAAIYNGGGHQKASGSGMSEDDRLAIIKYYFKDVKELENQEN
ncbi:MAG: hypothetical protein J1F35_07500 [Erysipelotrichales bacterium]|nr:hypothetical protein [Erysipelotrichales bacterium]